MMISIVLRTLFLPTSSVNASFFEVFSPLNFADIFTAGLILANIAVIFPICTSSMADFMAPQLLCPKTRISFAPETLQANSKLPSTSTLTILPALRATNISPMPLSNTSSTGIRLSRQDNTTDFGYCPPAVALTIFEWSRAVILFCAKRLLPSLSLCKIVSGDNALCSSAVVTFSTRGF